MTRRTSAGPTVSLFPFLAVLVCAMGALILLLLVNTRKIRQEAVAAHHAKQLAEIHRAPEPAPALAKPIEEPRSVTKSEPTPPPIDPATLPILPLLYDGPDSTPVVSPVDVLLSAKRRREAEAHTRAMEQRLAEQRALEEEWQARVEKLRAEDARLQEQLQALREQLAALQLEISKAEKHQSETMDRHKESEAAYERSIMREKELREKFAELALKARRLKTKLSQMEASQPEGPVLEIVAHDPATGTTRRPILIECTRDRLIFASEEIELTPYDLSGFTPKQNPLLAGTEALLRYYTSHSEDGTKPYVLMVVRPSGTVGFYVARKLLEHLDEQFGYELVQEDRALTWPPAEPEAVRACQAAIDDMLAQRDRFRERITTGPLPLAPQLLFAGPEGEFHLKEVDELRRGSDGRDELYIAGQNWRRSPHSASGGEVDPLLEEAIERLRGPAGTQSGQRGTTRYSPHPQGQQSSSSDGTRTGEPREEQMAASPDAQPGGADSQFLNRTDELPSGEALSRELAAALAELEAANANDPNTFDGDGTHKGTTGPARAGSQRGGQGDRELASSMPPGGPSTEFDPDQIPLPPGMSFPESSQPTQSKRNPANTGSSSSGGAARSQAQAGGTPGSAPPSPFLPLPGQSGSAHESNRVPPGGLRQAERGIGIERSVAIHLRMDSIQIGDDEPTTLPAFPTSDEVQALVAQKTDQHVRSWGPAPASFFWKPSLEIVVHPGGNRHIARVTELVELWGLPVQLDYVLD